MTKLTSSELALATRMIRNSDNDATTTLFARLGRAKAVSRSNTRLGLTNTVVNSAWGLTRTTADDQVTLLAKLIDTSGPLDPKSRKLASSLMTAVEADQRWGVSAAARPGEHVALKNGWDTRTADHGLWVVNSLGRIFDDDVNVSMAVLSHGHRTLPAGITVVEKVAKLTREHLAW